MARQYNQKSFFRQAPNRLLEQYFRKKGVLAEIKFAELKETKIQTVYDAWLALPEKERSKIEKDFREIDLLATEGGTRAIIDEADWHEEKLGPIFFKLKSFHDRAF